MREKEIAEVARPLPAHTVEADLHHPFARRQLRRVARKQLQLLFLPVAVEDRDRLAPGRFRRSVQLAQVRQYPVLWPTRRTNRLDQRIVLVRLAVLPSWMGLEKHAPPSRVWRRDGSRLVWTTRPFLTATPVLSGT